MSKTSLFEINDLSDADIDKLFLLADSYAEGKKSPDFGAGKKFLGSLFFQSSTRTRLGFEAAAQRLGLNVISIPDILSSRSEPVHKESIQDAVRVVQQMVDIAVVRTSEECWYSSIRNDLEVPVINGGDGNNQHPTQALSDMWIARCIKGDISGLRVGLVGNLGSRVHHSIIHLLCKLNPKEVGVFSEESVGAESHLAPLKEKGIKTTIYDELSALVKNSDVLEVMPLRMPDLGKAMPDAVSIRSRHALLPSMFEGVKGLPLVLHPGPRSNELPDDVILLENVPYFKQVRDAIFMKMAVFEFLLGAHK